MSERLETLIIGGGQAALALSYHLGRLDLEHLILERGRVAERWRSQRWDSLRFQFPNWSLQLPGWPYRGPDPDGFAPCQEVVRFIEDYAGFVKAPLRTGVTVERVVRKPGSSRFLVHADRGAFEAATVVLCTGPYQRPSLPAWSAALPARIMQVHSAQYRNPDTLAPGAVLVVGAGASGCQIVEELLSRGRRVFFSVGRHRRVPRRYRGRDMFWWLQATGLLDQPVERHPYLKTRPNALVTGADGGHDIDLRDYADGGATLLGRVTGADGSRLAVAADLPATIAAGDTALAAFTALVDAHVERGGGLFPETPSPPPRAVPGAAPAALDLVSENITSVVWASGFRYDFDWVELPVFTDAGEPVQRRGVSPCPGLYFLGLPWMHTLKSSILCGAGEDAAHVAEHIASRRRRRSVAAVR